MVARLFPLARGPPFFTRADAAPSPATKMPLRRRAMLDVRIFFFATRELPVCKLNVNRQGILYKGLGVPVFSSENGVCLTNCFEPIAKAGGFSVRDAGNFCMSLWAQVLSKCRSRFRRSLFFSKLVFIIFFCKQFPVENSNSRDGNLAAIWKFVVTPVNLATAAKINFVLRAPLLKC